MAMTQGSKVPGNAWKRFEHLFCDLFLKPGVILFFALAITQWLWMKPMLHGLVWTYLVVPSGGLVWVLAAGCVSFVIWSGAQFVPVLIRTSRISRLANAASKIGDLEGYRLLHEQRSLHPHFSRFIVGMAMTQILIPIAIALVLGGGSQTPNMLRNDHGKLRYGTQRENIQATLRAIDRMKMP